MRKHTKNIDGHIRPANYKMTEKEMRTFYAKLDDILAAYARRIERMHAVESGDLEVKKVWRRPHTVRSYKVPGHFMYITVKKEK